MSRPCSGTVHATIALFVRVPAENVMQPVSTAARVYDSRTIWFHWLTVLLIAGQWLGAHAIDMFPRGPLRIDAQSAHITFGALLGVLILARIAWRVRGGRQLPPADKGLLQVLAKAVHWGLYLLVLGTVGLGLTMLSLRSMSYFNLFMLPSLADGARGTVRDIREWHELGANTILIVAALHASAALLHQFVWRDGVLARMVPGLGR